MIGANRHTGKALTGLDHIEQSVHDILTTPIGGRVMRRDYGSRLPELIDAPVNGQTVIEIYAATAEAIERWEPRIDLRRVRVDEASAAGGMRLTLDYVIDGAEGQSGVVLEGARL